MTNDAKTELQTGIDEYARRHPQKPDGDKTAAPGTKKAGADAYARRHRVGANEE